MKKITFLTLLMFGFFLISTSINAQERRGEQIDKSTRSTNAIGVTPMSSGVTAVQMAAELIGTGITPSNVVYTGVPDASGLFTGGISGDIGIEQGVILSSGLATNVIGPNSSAYISSNNNVSGDADLDLIISPITTNDASVLEFDFVPTEPNLQISFVFGSDEYNEYVYSYNDVFAFFVDGVNTALLPATTIPVSISNVNNGQSISGTLATGPCNNCSYYIDNSTGSFDTEMDGYTTVITSTTTVTPGQTHHIKLAIADAGDYGVDSWVLIKGHSFGAPPPPACVVAESRAGEPSAARSAGCRHRSADRPRPAAPGGRARWRCSAPG